MTQDDKELLLKDLCGRVLYRPKAAILHGIFEPDKETVIGYSGKFIDTFNGQFEVDNVRLYLRPMSSMTEKEKEDYRSMEAWKCFDWEMVDWYNKHHLDYRGLIPKGLAWKAEENMYKFE